MLTRRRKDGGMFMPDFDGDDDDVIATLLAGDEDDDEDEEGDDDDCEKVSQASANYNPLGGTDTQACANCQWYEIDDDSCHVVQDYPAPIVATGKSDLWRAREMTPTADLAGSLQSLADALAGTGQASRRPRRSKATWSTAQVNEFPDSSFAIVLPGGTVEDGKTTPRSLRKLPYKDGSGKVDLPHLRNALARLPQSTLTPAQMATAKRVLDAAAKKAGVGAAKAGFWERVKALIAEAVGERRPPVTAEPTTSFKVVKDLDGGYRWVATVSNKFRDRDHPPEIFSDAAHKEFVAYLDQGGRMPEAWLWHTPGTRWGQADWAEYADGFLLMSGTVDPGMEHVAKALEADGDTLGVSHGYRFRSGDEADGIYDWYRTFEVSPLPREAAANVWTGIGMMRKEIDMAFSAGKRAFLVGKLGEERVAGLEQNTTGLAKALEDAGIDYKAIPEEEAKEAAATGTESAVSVKAITEALAPQFAEIGAGIKGLTDKTVSIEATVKSYGERLDRLERSEDEKVATLLTGRSDRSAAGYRASQSSDTIVGDKDTLAEARPIIDPGFLKAFQAQ